ncbi:MAG TPA: LamG-like jellyroll fold domain-containing protein [Candidatus Nitrosotalea sp.]|nr:LamG-like jellyroll fold domain-containing protein [Candidatus Nitrosotalea sp.]
MSFFVSLAYADQTALNQNSSILDNKKINPDGINSDRNKPDTISISENAAVTVHHKYVNPQDNTVTEKIVVYTSLNQNSIDLIKQNSDVKTIMDRISNLDRIRFNGRSIISENTLSNQEMHVEKLSSLMKPESEVYSPINAAIKNNLVTQNQVLFTDLFTKEISQDLQHGVESLFLISDAVDGNLLFFIHDLSNAQNPTMFLLLIPFSGYILIRAEGGKFQFNKKRSLSFCFIMILVISSFTTPLLTSENYWGMAFAESNSTENVNSTQSNISSPSLQLNSNLNSTAINSTAINSTFQHSSTHPVIAPNVTQSWQFHASLQNLTMVGKAKIENDSNITSLKLVGTGYVVTKNNSTRNLSALTISAWVKPDYSQGSPIFTIVSKENQFALSINNIIPPVHTATFSIFDGIKWQTVASTVVIGENWTHLAATFNGTTIGIYVNGTLQSTLAITGVPTIAVNGTLTTKTVDQLSSNSDIVMGASLNSLRQVVTNQFSGSIENVNLYDSQLSPSEITKMYYDNPLSGAFDTSSLSSASNIDANLTMSSNATASLTIPLNNTSLLNNMTDVANFTLIHAPIQINKPVIWTQNVTLSNQTNRMAVELPQDAQIININVANNTNSSTMYAATNSTTYSSILQSSTGLTNNVDIKTGHISKLEFLNDTNNTINKITYFAKMRHNAMTVASLNDIPGSVQTNKPTKLLVINDTAKRYHIRFETPAPYVVETNQSTSQLYHKTVIVEHNSTLHYTNVQSYSNVPENLISKGVHFKLFWMINGSKIDVTNDSRFAVQFVDTNNNGIVDQMKWIVPRLSAQAFSIEGVIIPISNAQLLDSNRDFVKDVYPQVQARDGNWTGDVPVGNYIRVTFGKNLTNINDITIFAKSNYSDASIEVYQKDSNQLLAHFGTISQDNKYKILLTDLNGSQNTFDLKIVENPINFDYIVDPSFSATPSDTLAISESAKMPQQTVTDTLPLSDKASPGISTKDTFAISESASITTNLLHSVSVTDTLPLSDKTSQNVVAIKDTLPLSDKVSPNIAIKDTFAISESGSVSNSAFHTISVTDTLPLSDKLSPNIAIKDTFAISESGSVSNSAFHTISVTDTLPLSDKASPNIAIKDTFAISELLVPHDGFSKLLSESVTSSDTATASKQSAVSLSESVTSSDVLAVSKTYTVSLSESVTSSDTTTASKKSTVLLSESVTSSDTATASKQSTVSLSESITSSDTATASKQSAVSLSESITSSDTATASKQSTVLLSESVTSSDVLATSKKSAVSLSESVTSSDVLATSKKSAVSLSESVTSSDTATASKQSTVSLSESITSSDVLATSKQSAVLLSESVTSSDTATASKKSTVSLSESVTSSDVLATSKQSAVSLSESVTSSDVLAVSKTYTVSLSESITMYDLIGQNIARNQILVPNTQTTVTVDPVKTNVIISSTNATLSTVIIPSTVTTAQLNYSKILQTGIKNTMQIGNPVTIIKDNANSQHVVEVNIPGNITLTGPSTWNGDLSLPIVVSNPSLPQEPNVINTPSKSIALGLSSSSLTFNKAIRMSFTGDAGLRAGYFNSAVPFTEITTTCTDDTQTTNDGLPAGGICKINVGHDLIIWTKHFTSFTTWSSTSSTSSTSISVSGTGNSGGGATGVGASAAAATSASNGGGAGPYLKIQKISYDVCDKQIVQIQIGTDVTDVDPMVIIRTSLTGVINAKLVPDQPYAQENVNATIRKLVYEATISPQEKSFEVVTLEYVGHNMFSFGKTVEITGCNETLDFTKLVTPVQLDQIDLSAPRMFDFKFQLGNGTQQLVSDSETPFVSGEPLSVYAIVDTPTQLVTSELRFTEIGSNDSAKYNAVTMNVAPLQVSNSTYLLSALVPSEFLQSPGIQYWIHVENSANKDIDSDVATMGVKPVNPINAKIELDVPQTEPAGITTLSSYITNNGNSLYGVVSLVVDNKTVYDSPPQIFRIGQTKVDLQWDATVLRSVSNHQVYAVAKFYDKSFETIPTTLDVFRSVQTVPLSQPIVLGPLKNNDGVIVANPTVLYSSFNNSDNMTYKVTAPDGTCVIGTSDNCLVTQSTSGSSNSKSIVIGDQIYRVRYSGSTSQLERFSITSVDPIIGQWKMEIDSQDGSISQDHTIDNVFLKVKYDSP